VNDVNAWGLHRSTAEQRTHEAERLVDVVLDGARQPLINAVVVFFETQISPLTAFFPLGCDRSVNPSDSPPI